MTRPGAQTTLGDHCMDAVAEKKTIQLEDSWKQRLAEEFDQPYMRSVRAFLREEKARGKIIFPRGPDIFRAFELTPFDQVKVVILGQDPYHGPNQAHGLSFSVKPGVAIPPSLRNIYQEIQQDLGIAPAKHGCLEQWACRGVLLLNSVLTVEQGNAASHQGKGWETFTDRVIERLSQERRDLVFMLWGSYAQRKGQLVDSSKHCVLSAPHPSPLSASRGFLGCRHFSKANHFLESKGQTPIDWSLESP